MDNLKETVAIKWANVEKVQKIYVYINVVMCRKHVNYSAPNTCLNQNHVYLGGFMFIATPTYSTFVLLKKYINLDGHKNLDIIIKYL